MRAAIQSNSLKLAVFAITCTLVVSLVFKGTDERIKKQEEQQLLQSLYEITDKNSFDNDIYDACILVTDAEYLGSEEPQDVYIGRKGNKPTSASIHTTAPDGYSGKIELLISINQDHKINGVRVLKHQETPGLGDKIELKKDDWILSFNGRELSEENEQTWAVKKDGGQFDQFTGATITPRAVVKAVKNTLAYHQKNASQLYSSTNYCRPATTEAGD